MNKMLLENEMCSTNDQNNSTKNLLLSVIVPFRFDSNLPYILDRLNEQCGDFSKNDSIEFIVVDSGSSREGRVACQEICQKYGVRYIYHDSLGQVFSIGAARDFGVRNASGKAITFLDVDLRVASDFWDRVLKFMAVFGISKNKKSFFVVPCLYLTQEGTEEFFVADKESRFIEYLLKWLNGDSYSIQNMAPCSSVMVVDRLYYLSVGGHRPEFRGHGYEDFELYHRLMTEEGVLPRSHDYYKDTKTWDTATYNGFRSQFSLLGRHALLSNIFVVHLWHPRPKSAKFYSHTEVNRTIWLDFFKNFDEKNEHPEPLIGGESKYKNVMFFGKPGTNASRCIKDIFPLIGNPFFVNEYDFIDDRQDFNEQNFSALINYHQIEVILFPNPYGNDARIKIYNWCRRTGFPFFCFDRGALPDSWFFDNKGFNSDSGSYHPDNWDFHLDRNQYEETIDYIHRVKLGNDSLEKQGGRVGGEALGAQLKIGGKKVLFVALQRPSDSVIRFMSGGIQSYDDFLSFIDDAARQLKSLGWVVLCKKHPLETESKYLEYAQYVPEDTHFIDLLELSDSVALVNSGVGVYAMMFGKPCFVFGQAFYRFEHVNQSASVEDVDKFVGQIMSGFVVDMDRVYRFINYLRKSFYSFGVSRNKMVKESDGSLRNQTRSIDFYEIRIPGADFVVYDNISGAKLHTSAPLFEKFKLDIFNKSKLGKDKPQILVKEAPQKKPVQSFGSVELSKQDKPNVGDLRSDNKARLTAKLVNNPHAYFKDSKHFILRPLSVFFKKR